MNRPTPATVSGLPCCWAPTRALGNQAPTRDAVRVYLSVMVESMVATLSRMPRYRSPLGAPLAANAARVLSLLGAASVGLC